MKQLFVVLCMSMVLYSYAQVGTTNDPVSSLYHQGIEYYEQGQYNQAREKFEQYLRNESENSFGGDASYYQAMSALKLYHQDGEYLMDKYLDKYPFHSKAGMAYFEVGNYFYDNQQYKKAAPYYRKSSVSENYRNELAFKLGYTYFNLKQMAEASIEFSKVDQIDSEFYHAANYYRGYINYKQNNLSEALEALNEASGSSDYIGSSALMIADIYLQNQDYNRCVNFCKRAIEEGQTVDPKLYYVLGNALLKQQKFKPSIEAFEQGLAASKRKAQPAVYFNLGEACRMDGQMEKATEYYSFSALDKEQIGYYSSYYLGKLYLDQENFEYAKSAFWQALKSEDSDIREESTFQLIKVEFKLGSYKECIEGAKQYQINFPEGQYTTSVNEFLTEAFLNTSDYDLAINYIESLDNISPLIQNTYQKVTFQKASDQFNNRKFQNAIYYFDKSLKYNQNKLLNIKAHFWKGEAFSVGKKYENAMASYKSCLYISSGEEEVSEIKTLARYGLGYCYFNTKDYENAKANFTTFLSQRTQNQSLIGDARARLGDCFYIIKDYANAINTYEKNLTGQLPTNDYINFQLGVVYALDNQPDQSMIYYRDLISNYPNSSYRDNGMYQLAELQFELGDYNAAVVGFSDVIEQFPEGQLVPYALLKRAVANYNLSNFSEATNDYKSILTNYISHQTANGALLGLQELYALNGGEDDFSTYVERYKEANPNDESLESIEFDAAKALFYNQKYQESIRSLQDFRSKYTASSYNKEVGYLIAEAHYRTTEYDLSIEEFIDVVSENSGKYLTRSLYRLGSLYNQKGEFQNSLETFKRLEAVSKSPRDLGNSWSGQMQSFYGLNKLDSAKHYAEKIIDNPKMNQDAQGQAILLVGNILSEQGKYDMAADQYLQLMNDIKDEKSAQAHYGLALVYYRQEKYKQSIETCYDLNNQYASYDLWLGRSFLLIADNYIAMNELFQAKATLNSIVEKSPIESIVQLAQEKLIKIEELENEVLEVDTETDSVINKEDSDGE